MFGPKNYEKQIEIEGVGPIWRDLQQNFVPKAVPGVPHGGMATHLVKILWLGVSWVSGPG